MDPLPRYWRKTAPGRWIVRGTHYAMETALAGYQVYAKGKPVFTVATLLEADQALVDLLDAGGGE